MDNIFNTLSEYYSSTDFTKFQNSFASKVYETLGTSYSNSENEVNMVTDMCSVIHGTTYQKLKFHSKKIHGTRSFVDFKKQNKLTTTELADMVIISVVTQNREIIYEKTAFIQNKKEDSSETWNVDQDQLYLLHNFPTFKGNKGIIKKNFKDEVVFLNRSQTLGNYGLFSAPGEMTLINALSVFKMLKGEKIYLSDIRAFLNNGFQSNPAFSFTLIDQSVLDEMFFRYINYFPKYGLPSINLPFLNNSNISFNIYEFIRNWTLFNIGDVVSVYGNIIDQDLSTFNRILLKEAGLEEFINTNIVDQEFDDDLIVVIAHLDLEGK